MKKYQATVRVKNTQIKTLIFAENPIHARLLVQYQFGFNSLISRPTEVREDFIGYLLFDDIVKAIQSKPSVKSTIKPKKPLNLSQMRLASLQKQKSNISNNIKAEKERQKIQRLQQSQQQISTLAHKNM